MKQLILLAALAGVAACHHAPDRPDPPCTVQCQEQSAESTVRRTYAFRALAGDRISFEQEARDLDAVRREYCYKSAMAVQDPAKQVAAVKTCRELWPIQADTTIEVK